MPVEVVLSYALERTRQGRPAVRRLLVRRACTVTLLQAMGQIARTAPHHAPRTTHHVESRRVESSSCHARPATAVLAADERGCFWTRCSALREFDSLVVTHRRVDASRGRGDLHASDAHSEIGLSPSSARTSCVCAGCVCVCACACDAVAMAAQRRVGSKKMARTLASALIRLERRRTGMVCAHAWATVRARRGPADVTGEGTRVFVRTSTSTALWKVHQRGGLFAWVYSPLFHSPTTTTSSRFLSFIPQPPAPCSLSSYPVCTRCPLRRLAA